MILKPPTIWVPRRQRGFIGVRMLAAAAGRAPSGPAPFDPLSINWHTAFWAEGPNMDNQAYADTDPVSLWPDESGNGNDASQGTAADQPAYTEITSVLNNKPSVHGDGNDYLDTALFTSLSQPNTIVAVVRFDDTNSSHVAFDGAESGARHQLWTQTAKKAIYSGSTISGGGADTNSHLFIAEFDATDSLEQDNTVLFSGNAGAQGITGVGLFDSHARNAGTPGFIAFCGLYDGLLTAQQKTDLRAWAESHYGITMA